jgi:hypothetical protein
MKLKFLFPLILSFALTSANAQGPVKPPPPTNVNSQTVNYTAVAGDNNKMISMNGASLTLTLPSPPSPNWAVWVQNLNASTLTVARGTATINGGTTNLTVLQSQVVRIFCNGTNYFSDVPLVAGTNITLTPSSAGMTITSSAGAGSAGGTNGQVQYNNAGALAGESALALSRGGLAYASNTGASGKIPIGDGAGHFVEGDPLVQGTQAAASTTIPNPVVIGGSDYSGTPAVRVGKVDSSGSQYTSIVGTPPVTISGTPSVAQSGTWTVQPGNTANTTPWLVNANENGTWTVQPGNTQNTTPWLMQESPTTTGGATIYRLLSAATTNSNNVKSTAGQLYGWYMFNTSASIKYVKLYNKATAPTVGTDTPVLTFPLPATDGAVQNPSGVGIPFATGIGIAITGAAADADTTAVAANDVIVNLFYK